MKTKHIPIATALACALVLIASAAPAQQRKPNILIIWGDDIGYWNLSAYNQGMMGYKTPNIDRIAKEGALFTDWYGQRAHRRALMLHHRPIGFPHRHAQSRPARR